MSAEAFGRQLLDEVKEESLVDVGPMISYLKISILIVFLM